jgi:hypothetical protein
MGTFKFRSYSQDFWAGVMFLGLGLLAVYLAKDYPMVAPNYAEQRRTLAKSIGLGTKGRRKAVR